MCSEASPRNFFKQCWSLCICASMEHYCNITVHTVLAVNMSGGGELSLWGYPSSLTVLCRFHEWTWHKWRYPQILFGFVTHLVVYQSLQIMTRIKLVRRCISIPGGFLAAAAFFPIRIFSPPSFSSFPDIQWSQDGSVFLCLYLKKQRKRLA